jgi:hypothetical protein
VNYIKRKIKEERILEKKVTRKKTPPTKEMMNSGISATVKQISPEVDKLSK